jgi:uncharacterized protein YcbK (DUF882 family)
MITSRSMTRRSVLGMSLLFPSVSSAGSLLDTKTGRGLFSDVAMRNDLGNAGLLNMFGDAEPELSPNIKLGPISKEIYGLSSPMTLALKNANTNETLRLDIPMRMALLDSQKNQLYHFLRDWRENETVPIDGDVLKTFIEICGAFSNKSRFVNAIITSGYRSKSTNEMLRRRNVRVAKNSLHVQARAIDFSLPGVSMLDLTQQAKKISRGGVGTYRSFIHIDSGPQRSWAS